jgi:hypothetical protein
MIYNKPYWGESHTVIRNSDVFDNATLRLKSQALSTPH